MSDYQLFSFYMDDNLFGLDILLVREVVKNLDITPVENTPDLVHGLINLRGQIVTAIDMAVAFGMEPRKPGSASRCIILKTGSEISGINYRKLSGEWEAEDVIGLIVDRVGEVYDVAQDGIDPPPSNLREIDGKFLAGVVKLKEQLMMVLNLPVILQTSEYMTPKTL